MSDETAPAPRASEEPLCRGYDVAREAMARALERGDAIEGWELQPSQRR